MQTQREDNELKSALLRSMSEPAKPRDWKPTNRVERDSLAELARFIWDVGVCILIAAGGLCAFIFLLHCLRTR